jgi:riboflavin synthase
MFTGIIEATGEVISIAPSEENIQFTLRCPFTKELKIDQSVAHNGCCLTIVEINGDNYVVTAIQETLNKSNLREWKVGTKVNLERCMPLNGRLDGHIVQGHVDTTGICVGKEDLNGSWKFTFRYDSNDVTVEKGSITVNGTSLTVVDSRAKEFSVCIIPYTYEFTNFHSLTVGDTVNLEFDIIGKYVTRLLNK